MLKQLFFLLVLFCAFLIQAQQVDSIPEQSAREWKLKGKVFDSESLKPLYGAHIINLNTVVGSISDKDGEFLIPVHLQDTLHVSFLGYRSRKIPVTAEMKDKEEVVFYMNEAFTDLQTVNLQAKLTGVLSVDMKRAPLKKDRHVHLNGLPQTFEIGAPKPKTYDTPVDAIFHPVDFLYEMFGKKPKELRKLRKLKQEEHLREMLEKKMNREVLMKYLHMDIGQLNALLDYCHYSEYFIHHASDLQVIEAVLECYENYKALREGDLHKK